MLSPSESDFPPHYSDMYSDILLTYDSEIEPWNKYVHALEALIASPKLGRMPLSSFQPISRKA